MLINYDSLGATRGSGCTDMLNTITSLFGSPNNLVTYKDSLLVGITNAPREGDCKASLEVLRNFIVDDRYPFTRTLAERVFVFDPLDRPIEGGWDLARLKEEIEQLTPIPKDAEIFSTVLNDKDQNKLTEISKGINDLVVRAFKKKEYPLAANYISRLRDLKIIGHDTVVALFNENLVLTIREFHDWEVVIKRQGGLKQFSLAENALREFDTALQLFDKEIKDKVSVQAVFINLLS